MTNKTDIKSMTLDELEKWLKERGEKAFRAKQVYQWMHEKLADSFEDMTNLPKQLRQALADSCELVTLRIAEVKTSRTDGTRKYLFKLPDGAVIESVLMRYRHGNSVCVSSQVGCRMGCRFCASALGGLERNLRPSEMLEQVYEIQKHSRERVSHVVVMGMGEPLDNYDNLVRFLRLISGEGGLNISQRNLTVSTCGLVEGIEKLADENLSVTLALSLHAPNDELRRTIMPVASRYAIKDVLSACGRYYQRTGRRLTFEYSLAKGINDSPGEARALAELLEGRQAHVNLIPVNPISEREYLQPDEKTIQAFKNHLEKKGIRVTIRREMGRDIGGACGQLRKSYMEKEEG